MSYNIQSIVKILNASFLNSKIHESEIRHLQYDSRLIFNPGKSMFIAIVGERRDGHDFIEDVYEKGVRNFLVSKEVNAGFLAEANFVKVDDTLEALHKLVAYHRTQFDIPIIGITGSNGKTIVKEWLYHLLKDDFNIVRSPKSYNSQLGVPLSVWEIAEDHNLGIFEAGISKVGEMQNLADIVQPTIGIFTNIGSAHDNGFRDTEEKVEEKMQLFPGVEKLIYCRDYPAISAAVEQKGFSTFTWSKQGEADLRLKESGVFKVGKAFHTKLVCVFNGTEFSFTIPFSDDASIENAMHCCAYLLQRGYQSEVIAERMEILQPVALRLEMKAAFNNCTLINDSYSADLDSLRIALDFFDRHHSKNSKVVILSDILQSGVRPGLLYLEVREMLENKGVDQLIAIGEQIRIIGDYLPNHIKFHYFPTTEAFLSQLSLFRFRDASILLKGARIFHFEDIASRLEMKAHKTVLEVDLNALSHNFQIYQRYIIPWTKIMVMVKASAYGSGGHEVARLLEFMKADYLAVAYADEGVDLRKAGIKLPIMVLNPEEASLETMIRHDLEPEIYSFDLLQAFADQLEKQMVNDPYPIHIKLETGMHRLGFEPNEIKALAEMLNGLSLIKVASVFSHLAASDIADHDAFTQQQIDLFGDLSAKLSSTLGYTPIKHILNSGGIVRFPNQQMDMVRLGIGLYGIDSSGTIQDDLLPVTTLKATLSQIKTVEKGESIGYNRAGRATDTLRIGTISIGYGDGFPRRLSNGIGRVLVRGQKVPVVGNVCMDMTMIDLSGVPDAREGDEVVIFGKDLPIQELADALGTIPYEVLTGISGRVKRVFFQE
ncbi:MAG: bifunctional UDP-N-acetylmuramoyl-tripeptide:D-alanyl-D-alanine ligase/alanine racemase [Bacteroidota bacterium]